MSQILRRPSIEADMLSQSVDPFESRSPLPGWDTRDDVWLVDAFIATAEDRERALPSWHAAAYARWCAPGASDALLSRLEDGRALLVRGPSRDIAVDPTPPRVDLRDLAEDAPPLSSTESESETEDVHFIEVLLVDGAGRPRANVLYELTFPDGSVQVGRSDDGGRLRADGLDQTGDCTIAFPELQAA
jgi:hypothetical protein